MILYYIVIMGKTYILRQMDIGGNENEIVWF